MIATSLALGWRLGIFFTAGVFTGIANGIAGGGTFFSFPTMLAMGISPLQANVSSTVGVVPSFVGGLRASRGRFATHRELARTLIVPCVTGTVVGCTLLFIGSPKTFERVVPWLIGSATLLFALAPRITARLAHIEHTHPARRWTLYVGIFLISIYGGYFGAGVGIMLLAVMAVSLPYEIHELQTLRNLLSILITSVAAVIFIVRGHLALEAVYMLMAGTLLGGWLGTRLIERLSPSWVRVLVVATGVITTIHLALQQ
ncbi:MAG TPA: sulfite exporter TauE/SafE family protein [Acidimicrobiales bacterium]|nr:sulfite exporter TauE/SafE family protein [Acidimicrobiales bacterium]